MGRIFALVSASSVIVNAISARVLARYRDIGLAKGFIEVVSGPLVRSSYRAERVLEHNNLGL